jgi:DNA-binding transcriptional LysR family regulator
LVYREVPCHELLKQQIIFARSCASEPWLAIVHRLVEGDATAREQTVSTFDTAMTLVAAGYGVTIAPAARLASYQCRGIAVRPLAGAPTIVMAYLLHTCTALTEPQERFARRVRSVT